MGFALESVYRKMVRFSYTSFDRIVIRGHDRALQAPAGFAWWCRTLRPDGPITDSWLASLARRFHEGVKNFAAEHHVPIVTAHRNMDKFQTAAEYRSKMTTSEGVYLILRARETASTYVSRTPYQPNPTGPDSPDYRTLIRRIGWVDHYYFYLVDRFWGPISIRFSSHPPFNVTVYLNGNRWLAAEATARGLKIATTDNSVVRCDDPTALQAIADSLDHRRLQSVCDHWVYRLFPVLTREERLKSFFRYRWFLHQVEMSHNMVFTNPHKLTETLERHVDLNRRHLHPRSLKTIFRNTPYGCYQRHIAVSVRHAFGGLTVLSAQYGDTRLKQYNNHQRTFRTEACVNDTTDLGVNKALENLERLRQRLLALVGQFQQAQAAVLDTTCHRGELTALAQPGKVNDVTTPGIKLENERIMAVLSALPQLAHRAEGFRSADVRPIVQQSLSTEYTPPQANYDLRKLRGKGLLERIGDTRRYRPTAHGLRVAVLLAKLREQLLHPLLAAIHRKRPRPKPRRPLAQPDSTYFRVAQALFDLCDHLALRPAA
jgi:DNA-binding transcriptional ArsR family regulator